MEDGLARRLAVAIPWEFLKSGGCPAYALCGEEQQGGSRKSEDKA